MDAAVRGSSNAPSPQEDNQYRFLAFVQTDGKVWELDGGLNGPLFRGVLGEGEDLFSEQGLALTVWGFLISADQIGYNEISIVAVTGSEASAQG